MSGRHELSVRLLGLFLYKMPPLCSTLKGALNTTDSDVKECGDHAGTRRFAVRCLVFELSISENSNLSYRLTNQSAVAKKAAEKFERVYALFLPAAL